MSDIFSRNVSTLGGVFTADSAVLTMVGQLAVLTQRLSFTYAQTITRLYEVGGPNIYYVGGRTQGQMSVDRIIGPSGSVAQMYTQYGNVCNAKQNIITLTLTETDCSSGITGTGSNYTMNNMVITQVSVGVAAQDMIISENTTMIYSSLSATLG